MPQVYCTIADTFDFSGPSSQQTHQSPERHANHILKRTIWSVADRLPAICNLHDEVTATHESATHSWGAFTSPGFFIVSNTGAISAKDQVIT